MISQRIQSIQASPTLAIAQQAKEMIAQGIDVLDFSVGEPDYAVPDYARAAAVASIEADESNYSAAAGLFELRERIARAHSTDTDQVVITNGGKEALYLLMQALLDDGDEVIIPAPYWVSYPQQVQLAGGTPVFLDTNVQFHITVDSIRDAITDRTKALVFNSPSNPTGAVQPQEVIDACHQLAQEHNILLILDEVYQTLVFDDATPQHPLVSKHVVVIDSVSKSHAMTGWRVGWAVGPQQLIDGMVKLKSHLSSNTANPMQRAALAAFENYNQEEVQKHRAVFQKRRVMVVEAIARIDGLELAKPEGAFYAFINCAALMKKKGITTSVELCSRLLEEQQIAFVPGSAFGASYDTFVRMSFAVDEATLKEGLKRLAQV